MEKLPKKMKAAILTQLRAPLEIAEIELPQTLAVGQVLVKVHFSGICGSQIGEIDGAKGEDKFLPHLLGHEASGTVVAIGAGVRHVKVGDNVVLHWRKGLGIEAETPNYIWNGRKVNAGWVTTLSEYTIVSENRVTPVGDSELDVAALFGCAVTTGFGIIENNAKVRIGESVVAFGAGGVGLNIIQAAALVSAYPIIAVDLYDEKLKLARTMGATHVINSSKVENIHQVLSDLIGKKGLDVFIDNTGQPAIIELGYQLTHAQGRVILVGVPHKGKHINIFSLPLHFGKELTGSHGGEAVPHQDIIRYQRLYQTGRIKLRELITDYYKLDNVNQAISDMRSGKVTGRCMIRMD